MINLFKTTKCTFACVPFATRGALETALTGLLLLALPVDFPLVFLDNDNMYAASLAALASPAAPFLGFGEDASELQSFSFMRRDASSGRVLEFAEKRCISLGSTEASELGLGVTQRPAGRRGWGGGVEEKGGMWRGGRAQRRDP